MKKQSVLNDSEIKVNGIEALNKTLGTAGAFRFLSLINKEPTDYVKVSKKLYNGQSVDAIFARAKKNWGRHEAF